MTRKPSLLIFDVNETLLDMQPLKKEINEELGSQLAFNSWFCRLLLFSSVETLTGEYRDFGEIGAAVLKMTAKEFSAEISEERIKEILGKITDLDPHPEVPEALEELRKGCFKLVALTNGGKDTVNKQLKTAKLEGYFDAIYSVEAVGKFKPHPETYHHVLKKENSKPDDSMLIAAHAWDITGAQRAGLQTAFIHRPGKFLYPLAQEPEITGKDLKEIIPYLNG
ncbi:haloacid dehalogenase type II [Salinimicrobium sp. CDJ15-81-2]|nr:haloacid dehalogenase type II [Salinimicrobium nanhaiense]